MIKVSILGSGNVAQHLALAIKNIQLSHDGVQLLQVFARQPINASFVSYDKIISSFDDLLFADVFIIAVSDVAIATVANQIPYKDSLIVHTSGASSIEEIQSARKGVFYPLQTFTKGKEINFKNVPVCIEATNTDDKNLLLEIAKSISNNVQIITSEQRKILHLAAVFVNNFTNYMYQIGSDLCSENNLDFTLLHPIITETANKISAISPKNAQTGPAIRGDKKTIKMHENSIKNPDFLTIYQTLTKAIQRNGEKL